MILHSVIVNFLSGPTSEEEYSSDVTGPTHRSEHAREWRTKELLERNWYISEST